MKRKTLTAVLADELMDTELYCTYFIVDDSNCDAFKEVKPQTLCFTYASPRLRHKFVVSEYVKLIMPAGSGFYNPIIKRLVEDTSDNRFKSTADEYMRRLEAQFSYIK